MIRRKLSIHRWLVLIVVVFLALGTYYSITTPIFETPDEVWHYAYIREFALYHRLPIVDADGQAPYRHEGLQPPLYYALGSIFISWMSESDLTMPTPNPYARIGDPRANSNDNRNAFLHSADEEFPFRRTSLAVHLIRWYSLLLGAATIVLTYALAKEIFSESLANLDKQNQLDADERRQTRKNHFISVHPRLSASNKLIALCATAFVAFLPQFIFISSAISNDNLATLLTVATLWQIARIMRCGFSRRQVVLVGILTGAALLTKLNTIALGPLVVIALAYPTLKSRNWRDAILSTIIIGTIVALCAGWWYIRNLLTYGDLTTFGRLAILVGERARPLNFFRWVSSEGEGLRLSMWGVFGWFNIRASQLFYLFFDTLAAIGLIGMMIALVRRTQLSIRLAILPLWCAMIFISFWGYASIIVTSQGRLLFPALPAFAILWSWGIATLVPSRWHSFAPAAITTAFILIAALVPSSFIAPAYTPAIIAENQIPQNTSRLNAQFDNGVEWLATSVDRSSTRPGETLAVTIYQRVPAGDITQNAIYIHVVNSADVIIAQRDSFIGAGNLTARANPTIIADTYNIAIPITAPAPDEWKIQAGMYDPATSERARANQADTLTLDKVHAEKSSDWGFDFDGHATLDGVDYHEMSAVPGGTISLTLHWRNTQINMRGYNVFVHALGTGDQTWATTDVALDTTRPTQIDLRFKRDTPPGIYPLELGVYPLPDGDRVGVFDRNGQESGDRIFLGPAHVAP
ncbi:MAG: glycosyltransferase family 39 protein [Chloroflexi bacterium]|nr:glycosyltransferase family 39 protein [Chloroflexota bacterium]